MNLVNLTINNKSVSVPKGSTILQAAKKLNIKILHKRIIVYKMCHKFEILIKRFLKLLALGRVLKKCNLARADGTSNENRVND